MSSSQVIERVLPPHAGHSARSSRQTVTTKASGNADVRRSATSRACHMHYGFLDSRIEAHGTRNAECAHSLPTAWARKRQPRPSIRFVIANLPGQGKVASMQQSCLSIHPLCTRPLCRDTLVTNAFLDRRTSAKNGNGPGRIAQGWARNHDMDDLRTLRRSLVGRLSRS